MSAPATTPGDAAGATDLLKRRLERAVASRKAAEALLEAKSLELYEANRHLRSLNTSLEESETRSRKLVELVPEAILVHTDGRIAFVNPAGLRLFGAPSEAALLGTLLLERVPAAHHAALTGYLALVADERRAPPLVLPLLRLDGAHAHVELMGTAIGDRGAPSVLLVARDITQQLQHEASLEHQAMHDLLTDLPNRMLLQNRLARAIARAERHGGCLGLMFIDLDQFKHINDSLGHGAGDEVLIAVAARLRQCVREVDTVARLGGDEFVLLLERVDEPATLAMLAQRVVTAVCAPVALQGQLHGVTCSIGIASYPADGRNVEDLLKRADLAMYRAKAAGRNNFQFFHHEMQQQLDADLLLERQLQRALERDEFVLHYQPQLCLRSGRIVGVEALLRWQSPELGLVPPLRFIPFAEQSSLILGIGAWVLEAACAQAAAWRRQGLPPVRVSINVAARQVAEQPLGDLLERALRHHALCPSEFEIELTESASMGDPEATLDWMRRIKALGVSLAIDDFGTGYSNLGYLKRFPVDRLKIDRAFVQSLDTEPRDRAITTAVIALAQSLGMRTVAEGVETPAQQQLLAAQGCDEMQGYGFSRPLPAEAFAALLASHVPQRISTEALAAVAAGGKAAAVASADALAA